MAEETGYEVAVGTLLWIVENFFRLEATDHHKLAFTYPVSPTDPTILNSTWTHQTTDGGVNIELRWFDFDHLEAVDFQPAFLKPLLRDPPATTRHVIVREPPQKEADR